MDNRKGMTWINIDRDENGIATEECLESMRKAIPFVFVSSLTTSDIYVGISNEKEFELYKDELRTNLFDTHYYLPIPKLEV